MDPLAVADLALNAKEPCILRKAAIPWDCFNVTFDEWCEQFDEAIGGKKLEFERGSSFHTNSPQWEKFREKEMLTIKKFLKHCHSDKEHSLPDYWYTYSYKNINEIPVACRKGIDFSAFGFSNAQDISVWLSSTGAHTPCHYDTYGCNIVVQVFGRKMWLLFPPETLLTAVRIPYEESSVYCSETFYSPKNLSQHCFVDKSCYKCVLEPADVLIVPNRWWHYVENLTPSLSINTWIPLAIDDNARLEECIVRYIVSKFTKLGTDDELKNLLNPNEVGNLQNEEINLNILNHLLQELKNQGGSGNHSYLYHYMEDDKVLALARGLKAEWVQRLPENEFHYLMRHQIRRHISENRSKVVKSMEIEMKQALINAVCNPQIVANIKLLFIKYADINN